MKEYTPTIAGSHSTPGYALLETSRFIQSSLNTHNVKTQRHNPLAGPNDTIQIILNQYDWIIVLAILAKFAPKAFFDELQKRAAGALWEKGQEIWARIFREFSKAIENPPPHYVDIEPEVFLNFTKMANEKGTSVILGLPITPNLSFRNAGIELKAITAEEFVSAAAILALTYEEIQLEIDKLHEETGENILIVEQNSDCSGKFEIDNDGFLVVKLVVRPPNSETGGREVVLRFDPSGNRVD